MHACLDLTFTLFILQGLQLSITEEKCQIMSGTGKHGNAGVISKHCGKIQNTDETYRRSQAKITS